MNHNKTILIDGVRYHKNCYYLAESPKKKSPCEVC